MTTRCPVSQKTRCLCLKILTAERSKENSDILMGGNVEAKTPTKVGSDGGRERGSCGHHGLISMGAVVGQSQSSSQDSGNNWCIPSHSSLGCWWENGGESTPVQQVGLCLNLQTSGMFHSFSVCSLWPEIWHPTTMEAEQASLVHAVTWPNPKGPPISTLLPIPPWWGDSSLSLLGGRDETFRAVSGRGPLPVKTPTVGCLPSFCSF